jgi:hypothetical protein
LYVTFKKVLGHTELLIQWDRKLFLKEYSGRGVKLTTHLQLVLKPRKCGSTHLLPYTPSWRNA